MGFGDESPSSASLAPAADGGDQRGESFASSATMMEESAGEQQAKPGSANGGTDEEPAADAATTKELRMESELHELKAALAAMTKRQERWESRQEEESEEPAAMPDEHKLALRHRRYHDEDDTSGSSDDEYTQFDQQRRRMERMYVRELQMLHREKKMVKDIRALRRDRDSLKEKERAWEAERIAMETSRKKLERELQHKEKEDVGNKEGPSEEEAPLGQTEDAPAEPEAPPEAKETIEISVAQAAPEVKYMEWVTFKAVLLSPEADSYAIAVLRGEPVITHDYSSYYWRPKKSKRGHGEGDDDTGKGKASAKKKEALVPGQAPLPERIRIHSTHIIKILEKISGNQMTTHVHDTVVMIRPFKFLVYYEEQIRHKFSTLLVKFSNHGDVPEAGVVATAPTAASEAAHPTAGGDVELPSPEKVEDNERQPDVTEAEEKIKQDEPAGEEEDANEYTSSTAALEQLGCLVDFLDTAIARKRKYLASDACEKVAFTDIWYLFRPGDEVINQNRKQVYRVLEVTSVGHKVIPPWRNYYDKSSAESEKTPVSIHCVYVDFTGKDIGPVSKVFQIARFDGEVAVTSLDVYPLRFAEARGTAKGTLRQKLIERGRVFLDVAGIKHMHYNGLTLDARDEVDSQVVVDFEEAFAARGNAEWRPAVEPLIGNSQLEKAEERVCSAECCRDENISSKDSDVESKRGQDYIASLIPEDRGKDPSVAVYPRPLKRAKSRDNTLQDDELLIMSYRVFAFVLRSRKWAQLDLTYLTPIVAAEKINSEEQAASESPKGTADEKQETAFEQLVLPPGHKQMVQSLIAQHYRDKESATVDTEQVDIVRGKGKGLIILLHGAPGVGKTTTAEGVAELFQKPLFQITCGDLGTTASEVEIALETNFALANRWGCILLLDEADVFLTSRAPQDFIRNGLVAVFLRVLEYYAGILFLTTNRIGDFDEAFASRVHISLHYPQLDLESTLAIFKLNLRLIRNRFKKKAREIEINEKEILEFANRYWTNNEKMRWNGRQIRNGCQTALALAEFDAQGGSHERVKDAHAKVNLDVDHLETVSGAYLDFISYLKKVYGQDADRRAKAIGIRAREADGRREEAADPKGTPAGKRWSEGHHASVSSLGPATPQPEQPSPTPQSVYPQQAPMPGAPLGPYQQQYFYQQQPMPQPPHSAQAAAYQPGYPPQANPDQISSPPPGQPAWQGPNASAWQPTQQPMPGHPQYGPPMQGVWSPGPQVPPQGTQGNQQGRQ